MQTKHSIIQGMLWMLTLGAHAQGQFVYDQQSTNTVEGAAGLYQSYQPMGQSFLPSFSSVGFVQLSLYEGDSQSNVGGTVSVNLRSGSISGAIVGSTLGVFIPDNFFGIVSFIFSNPVTVTPGVTYYLQPVIQSGSAGFASFVTDGSYPGGTLIYQGTPILDRDLWFREGVVPEPSSGLLFLIGGGVVFWRRRGGLAVRF